jgi:diguanylate cyclase (GGDEF)-like protein
MKKILKWLGVQDAFEKGLIARTLVILCLLFVIFGVVFVTTRVVVSLIPGYPDAHWTDLVIESAIFFSGLIALRVIRADRMRAASRVLLGALLIVVTMQAYVIGDPANDIGGAMGLLLFAFLAILLLDRWDRWIAIALVVGVFVGLNILAASGYLPPVIYLDPLSKTLYTFFVWIAVGIIIAMVTIAAMGAMRREPQLIREQIDGSDHSTDTGTAQKNLPYLSMHDALTGLYNRLFFETEFARLEKSRFYPISVIMAEIDALKNINDANGLNAGDQVLIAVARLFTKVFRQEDIITRYGGDDFVVLLPGADAVVVSAVIGRIKKQIDAYNKEHMQLPISLSMGVSTANQGDSLKDHLKLAGEHLQQEKLIKSQK